MTPKELLNELAPPYYVGGLIVRHGLRIHDDAHLAAGLDCVRLLNAFHRRGKMLQPVQALDVAGHRLRARRGRV